MKTILDSANRFYRLAHTLEKVPSRQDWQKHFARLPQDWQDQVLAVLEKHGFDFDVTLRDINQAQERLMSQRKTRPLPELLKEQDELNVLRDYVSMRQEWIVRNTTVGTD